MGPIDPNKRISETSLDLNSFNQFQWFFWTSESFWTNWKKFESRSIRLNLIYPSSIRDLNPNQSKMNTSPDLSKPNFKSDVGMIWIENLVGIHPDWTEINRIESTWFSSYIWRTRFKTCFRMVWNSSEPLIWFLTSFTSVYILYHEYNTKHWN